MEKIFYSKYSHNKRTSFTAFRHNDVEFIARANEWVSSDVYDSPLMGESDEQNGVAPYFAVILESFGTSEVRPSSRESRVERRTKRPAQREHWAIGFAV